MESVSKFQSTLPREERQHAMKEEYRPDVFQSTLPREERPNRSLKKSRCKNFNPRSHERSDGIGAASIKAFTISIHAPTRGATLVRSSAIPMSIFQSTLPREERRNLICIVKTSLIISIHAPTRGATAMQEPV